MGVSWPVKLVLNALSFTYFSNKLGYISVAICSYVMKCFILYEFLFKLPFATIRSHFFFTLASRNGLKKTVDFINRSLFMTSVSTKFNAQKSTVYRCPGCYIIVQLHN